MQLGAVKLQKKSEEEKKPYIYPTFVVNTELYKYIKYTLRCIEAN